MPTVKSRHRHTRQIIRLGELAQSANPMRGAVKPGTEPGLELTQYFGRRGGATANGVHAMIVEVDPQTFDLKILRYVVVHDCGTVINPMILDGQIHGGVAQGIGNAFYEQLCSMTRASCSTLRSPTICCRRRWKCRAWS